MKLKKRWNRVSISITGIVSTIAATIAIMGYIENQPNFDITGSWMIYDTILKTTYTPHQGLRIGFRVSFTQSGKTFEGVGEKWSENGKELRGKHHTPISITGVVEGSMINAIFKEKGLQRETSGTFVWHISNNQDKLIGTFSGTGSKTEGVSELVRR